MQLKTQILRKSTSLLRLNSKWIQR